MTNIHRPDSPHLKLSSLPPGERPVARISLNEKTGEFSFDWDLLSMQYVFERALLFSVLRIIHLACDHVIRQYQEWRKANEKKVINVSGRLPPNGG